VGLSGKGAVSSILEKFKNTTGGKNEKFQSYFSKNTLVNIAREY